MAHRRARSWLLAPLAVYALGAGAFVVGSPVARTGFPLDDAWIHAVYARSFAALDGFAYNDEQETGATSPLWVVVSAPAHWLSPFGTAAVVGAVKLIGVGLGALAVTAVFALAGGLAESRPGGAIAATFFALDPRLPFAVLSGMEGPLVLALWLGAGRAALARRWRLCLLLLGLCPLARPEAVLVVASVLGAAIASLGVKHRLWRRASTWGALIVPSLVWALFCLAVNGHPLPNTFYVKATPFLPGAARLRDAAHSVALHGWGGYALAAALVAFVLVLVRRPGPSRLLVGATLLVAPSLYLLGVHGSRPWRPDGYYWTRWSDPAALVLVAAAGTGLAAMLVAASRAWRERRGRFRVVAAGAVGLTVLASMPALARNQSERRHRLASDCRAIRQMNVRPALWIRDHTAREARIGANDAGAVRYFGERTTIDLLGLNNGDIAFHRDAARGLAGRLDWLVVFPAWVEDAGLLRVFDRRRTFRITPEEYTICECPEQTVVVVAERKREPS